MRYQRERECAGRLIYTIKIIPYSTAMVTEISGTVKTVSGRSGGIKSASFQLDSFDRDMG